MRGATLPAVVFATLAAATTANATPNSMELLPGGVADEAGRSAYLHNTRGGIDAVDLATGKTKWSDAAPQRPLAVAGDRLLVEVLGSDGAVRLVVREARAHGKTLGQSAKVALPSWASGAARAGVSYWSAVDVTPSPGVVVYRWSATRRWPGGMHPPRGRAGSEGELDTKEASGELSVDIGTGKTQAPGPPHASLPYATEHGTSQRAWYVDGFWCAFATEPREGTTWLIVRCAASGGTGASRDIPVAQAPAVPALSTDGHLARIPASIGAGRSIRLPSGETAAAIPAAATAFASVGSLILTLSTPRETAAGVVGRRELRAWSPDGTLLWTHALYTAPWSPPRQ